MSEKRHVFYSRETQKLIKTEFSFVHSSAYCLPSFAYCLSLILYRHFDIVLFQLVNLGLLKRRTLHEPNSFKRI